MKKLFLLFHPKMLMFFFISSELLILVQAEPAPIIIKTIQSHPAHAIAQIEILENLQKNIQEQHLEINLLRGKIEELEHMVSVQKNIIQEIKSLLQKLLTEEPDDKAISDEDIEDKILKEIKIYNENDIDSITEK